MILAEIELGTRQFKRQEILKALAATEGESIQSMLEKAVADYRRRKLLQQGNSAYARLRADPQAWEEELEERRIWAGTLADGLEDSE